MTFDIDFSSTHQNSNPVHHDEKQAQGLQLINLFAHSPPPTPGCLQTSTYVNKYLFVSERDWERVCVSEWVERDRHIDRDRNRDSDGLTWDISNLSTYTPTPTNTNNKHRHALHRHERLALYPGHLEKDQSDFAESPRKPTPWPQTEYVVVCVRKRGCLCDSACVRARSLKTLTS